MDKDYSSLAKTLLLFAERVEAVSSDVNYSSIQKLGDQFSKILTNTSDLKISDSTAAKLIELSNNTDHLSDLQIIAISKEIAPSKLRLSEDQKKIRKSITKEDAKVLSSSSKLQITGDKFSCDNQVISTTTVKNAIRASNIFDDVSVDDIFEFSSFIYKYPYLATCNPVGEKILKACKKIEEASVMEIDKGTLFYRGRALPAKDQPFSEQEMRMAPFKVPGQGRFNTQGVSRFYLASSKEDAISEISKHSNDASFFQIAKYQASEKLRLLDLAKIDNHWSEACLKRVPKPSAFNVEYLCSGFLAQCVEFRKCVDGISYGEPGHKLFAFFSDRKFDFKNSIVEEK